MAAWSDDELMRLYRDGDEAAFHALFDRYRGLVFHYARLMLDDATQAEDVLQETFLSVSRGAARYEGRGHFKVWLMRIVRNRCLNRLEAARVRQRIFPDEGPETSRQEPPAQAPSPSARAEARERLQSVEAALKELPARQREAITLYAFDGMAYRNIAEVLEMPVNTVKTMIHRARATLAKTLETAGTEGPPEDKP